MFTVQDFLSKFENYSDLELNEVYSNPQSYSPDALQAVKLLIEKRGGIDAFVQRIELEIETHKEIQKVNGEIAEMIEAGSDAAFMKGMINSDKLSKVKIDHLINAQVQENILIKKDEEVTPKTIAGSIAGICVAGVVGGILWGASLIYTQRAMTLLGIGLVLLCYWTIRLFTGKSKRNTAVLISTIIALFIAGAIGHFLYQFFGHPIN